MSFDENLTRNMESQMFYAYIRDHFVDEGSILNEDYIPPRKENNVKLDSIEKNADYKFTSYAKTIKETGYAREGKKTMIFVDNGNVVLAFDNTYKYQEWDELFEEITEYGVCGKKGLTRVFIIYTDSSYTLPVWTLYEKTIAGFAVDMNTKTVTHFSPESAILIFHSLYQLCSLQYSYNYCCRLHMAHLYNDLAIETGTDPYVKLFKERLDRYQYDYDEMELIMQYEISMRSNRA